MSFPAATRLWESPVLTLPSNQPGESRHLVIGKIGARFWTAIITRRGSALRLISVRASRANEKRIYDEILEEK
ncbi:MAG: BrnT family toxin [Opitutaceae bacterium]|nr:BrnT family toxin [Opitutaceae bacterium]